MHYDRTIIGYHGCSASRAESLLAGESFKKSENDYDWLGQGVYFWEYGLDRAWRWAKENEAKWDDKPAVVGAVVQLGNCFDLLDTRATEELAEWAQVFAEAAGQSPLPRNKGRTSDLSGRYLDCAIINFALQQLDAAGTSYDTVRCGFVEGDPIYKDRQVETAIRMQSHVQIAVRNPACIIGTFRPRQLSGYSSP